MTFRYGRGSVKTAALLAASACTCMAAIGNLRVLGTTATQAVIAYTAPDGNACTIQLSQSAGLTPLALDVDPGTFANSNSDLSRPSTVTAGLSRTVVLGQRTAQYATAGTYSGVRHFSRALQALTPYFGKITCPSTGDIVNFTFTTGNIPLGSTYGDPWLSDAAHPGDQPWPEAVGGLTPESFIDPLTGVLLQRIGVRGNSWGAWPNFSMDTAYNQSQIGTLCGTGGAWTNPCYAVSSTSGQYATAGNTTGVLVVRPPLNTSAGPWNAGYGGSTYAGAWSIDQLSFQFTAHVSATAFPNFDGCLSLNGGHGCASAVQQVALTTADVTYTLGAYNTSNFGVLPWLLDTSPRFNAQESSPHSGSGTITNSSGTYTLANQSSPAGSWTSDYFSLYWLNGSIRISTLSISDACTTSGASSSEYVISSFTDGAHIVLSGTPPTGSVYWCENNFAVMLWRDVLPTDGSTVSLQASKMSVMESQAPFYPDYGASTACYNTMVSNGSGSNGFWCLYGGIYWIDPTNPANDAYYGHAGSGGGDNGTPITNTWQGIGFPSGESADIDETQSTLTFYGISQDPRSHDALVIQGVFNPPSIVQPTTTENGTGYAQIGNASVSSTTAYSVAYNNGLTFTNLTPQTSASEDLFQQAALLDPTFNASYYNNNPYTGGSNCQAFGMSTGVLFASCASLGQDTPAWIFAFSPGDGNPAHAGLPGGPRLIGAINTFNTPNGPIAAGQGAIVGRSLHSASETGETGWLAIVCNYYPPITTSNIGSIPATGPASCASFGLSTAGDCIAIQMNSYTAHSVTGYEPYLASPSSPFLGTPGELRTTQIGDTACVTTSNTGCSWLYGANELMTLRIKNYGGANGLFVFQRNAYGSEVAISSGPVYLWWASYQSSIPPGSTNVTGNLTVWWSPLTGCGGSPDPHGTCLLQDNNNTGAHAEWRNGGAAEVTNVPEWAYPIWGWSNVYQTLKGYVPGILGYPPANVTPYAVAGVNYVNQNVTFSGVLGHPFGADAGTHPNPAGANASAYEALQAFDNYPVQGGQNEPIYTNVAGQLYVATPSSNIDADDLFGYAGSGCTAGETSGCVAINRKLMATGASCGSHPLIDVSGPSSSIAADISGSYTYGVVRVAGELRAGSTVGQVYVNCPGVLYPYCSGVATHGGTPLGVGNDICVGNISNNANAIVQFTLGHTDKAGAYSRSLVSATSRLRMVNGFENNQPLPDNSWLLYRQEWLNYQRPDMWMAKMLPYPAPDSVARWDFVPVALTLNPPAGLGVNNAVAEFGYQEYGAPGLINCTTRNDACIATASTVTPGNPPFYFASENPAGASCASGCTIAIPAISQRILYYQVKYRSANNTVLSADPPAAVVVP